MGQQLFGQCSRQIRYDENCQIHWKPSGRPAVTDNLANLMLLLSNRYKLYNSLVSQVFENDLVLLKGLQNAFAGIMATRVVLIPEYTDQQGRVQGGHAVDSAIHLSTAFSDSLMSGYSEAQLKELHAGYCALLNHSASDVFLAHYAKNLAVRLLFKHDIAMDIEVQMVQQFQSLYHLRKQVFNLKNMLDPRTEEYVQQGQIEDYPWSQSAALWCQSKLSNQGSVDGIRTDVKVLKSSSWPFCRPTRLNVHPQIARCFDQWEIWYRSTDMMTDSEYHMCAGSDTLILTRLYGLSTVRMSLWFTGPHRTICTMKLPMASILLLFAGQRVPYFNCCGDQGGSRL